MPQDSAVARSVHGEKADWSIAEHLTASVVDELRALNYQTALSRMGKKGRQLKPPKPLPRPGFKPADGLRFGDAKKTPQEMRELLDRWAGR